MRTAMVGLALLTSAGALGGLVVMTEHFGVGIDLDAEGLPRAAPQYGRSRRGNILLDPVVGTTTLRSVRVFNRGTILEYGERHADAAQALRAWYAEADAVTWGRMADVHRKFPSADRVGDRLLFDIKGNNDRLVVAYDFPRKSLFIKWFGTHADYDKIDVATVEYTK